MAILTDSHLRQYIGMTIKGGIVVGARRLDLAHVEFRVLVDGQVEVHLVDIT